MATITVNTTADTTANDGFCSLREAITAANNNTASGTLAGECVAGFPGTDRIVFNIPGAGLHAIIPASALPVITEPVFLDGFTQPGSSGATWPPALKIILNGSNAGANVNGLNLSGNALFSTVRGLVINQFGQGGLVIQSNNNTIQGNFLGTDATGTARMNNGFGIKVTGATNLIGGTTAGSGNLISGNGTGLWLAGPTNTVQGNYIGTDVTGTLDLGNSASGVRADDGTSAEANAAGARTSPGPGGDPRPAVAPPPNVIGGSIPGARNIISGNDQDGVFIQVESNLVGIEGNFIGTDVTGTARLGNSGNGIWIKFTPYQGTVIGGKETARNIISANGGAGIKMGGDNSFTQSTAIWANYIGTDVTGRSNLGNGQDGVLIANGASGNEVGVLIGTVGFGLIGTGTNIIAFNGRDGVRVEGNATRNSIAYNSIFSNAGLGINLGTDGITPNDPGDADTGPNNVQNFPVLTSAITNGTATTIQGTLNSRPNLEYTLQFFSSTALDSSGNGEGQTWVGDQVIHTDGSGNSSFTAILQTAVPPGRFVTATAAYTTSGTFDQDSVATSEFSAGQMVQGIGVSSPSQLLNISTRLRVLNGENVLIGGFIITGTDAKKVIIRGIGPSLAQFFNGVLVDPTLELFQGNTLLDSNDNWIDRRAEIEATGIPPANDLESAIVRTLAPGAYTAIVRGKNDSIGIGLVEAYDLDQAANSKLANISTRGFVDSGDNVMIGGFIIGNNGGGGATVVVRAIGPALGNFGIAGALQDPTLNLVNAQGVVLRSNNNWRDSQQSEIEAVGLQPGDDRECAVVQTLAPGNYTAIVRGNGNTTGVGLVEVYNVE
jgi:CSLREA domain-containing protein